MRTTENRSESCLQEGRTSCRALFVFLLPFLGAAGLLLSFLSMAGKPEELSGSVAVEHASGVPVGYILPSKLDGALVVKDTKAGDTVVARITQEVPLPEKGKIALRSLVKGSIVAVTKDEDEKGVGVTLRFDQLNDRGQSFSMATSLRALASFNAVRDAETPRTGADGGSPSGWANTFQVGGDIRYGDGGIVRDGNREKVGKGVRGGVLVYLRPNPERGCESPTRRDGHVQALWVFSANACGVYGLTGVDIYNGESTHVGEFTLHFEKMDMKLVSGTGMLLAVVERPR